MGRLDFSTGARGRRGEFRALCCATALLLLVVLAGCNGGGNGGGGSSNAISVVVAPPAAIVQLNQTLQMSAAVVNAPNLAIVSGNGAVRLANVVTITATAAHGFAVGNPVQISGVSDASFVGTFLIATVPSPTTFTFAQTGADATSGGGNILHTAVRWQVNGVDGGNATSGTITVTGLYTAPVTLPPITTATIGAGGAVRTSNVVTITTTAAHTFTAGQVISIVGVTDPPPITATIAANGAVRAANIVTVTTTAAHNFVSGQVVTIAGVGDATFNGAFVIASVPSTTTFSYLNVAADATSGGGTASVAGVSFNGTFAIASVPSTTTFTVNQAGPNATSGGGTVNTSAVQIKAISVADTTKEGTASVGLDSGIILSLTPTLATVATSELVQFVATNSGATSTTINFLVNDVAGGNATVGTIDAAGLYTAPAAVPSPATVTVKAQAVADPTKFVTANVTISSAAATPTFTALWPTVVAQGAAFQDFYIEGTNFLSTTAVRFNGMTPPTAPIAISSTLLRVRIPASMLDAAGVFPMTVDTQAGLPMPPAPINVTVTAERPALVGPAPDSVLQGPGVTNMDLHGGYYSSSTVAEFDNGSPLGPIPDPTDPSRKLQAPVNPNQTAGLYAVTVRNAAAAQPVAVTNLAIQPDLAMTPPTVSAPIPVGLMPSAVAVNHATGVAVVLNSGDTPPTISVIDLATNAVIATHLVGGTSPTGLAVDSARNLAIVANNGSNDISVINITTGATTIIPPQVASGTMTQLRPFSVGVNPLTGIGLVANQSTNEATVIDVSVTPPVARGTLPCLATAPCVTTGTSPRVAVEPRLNWAIVTPGGAGAVAIVDLGAPAAMPVRPSRVIATVLLGSNTRGISINRETRVALLADPGSTFMQEVSLLGQVPTSVTDAGGGAMETGHVATAINPFTDMGVATNPTTDMVSVIDLRGARRILQFAAGADPIAVDIDPGTNKAVIANQADGTVSIATFGPTRGLQVLGLSPAMHIAPTPAADLVVTVTGIGFTGAAVVRVDEAPLATTVVSGRQLTATIPAAMLGQPRNFALDVIDAGGRSNVIDLPVWKAVTVGSGTGTEAPISVAIDQQRDLAVVANSGTDQASIVNLNTLAITNVTVGDNPQGVAIYSRGARAIVSNRSSNSISIVDIDPASATFGTQVDTATVGGEPLGIGINDDLGQAVVANSAGNTITIVNISDGTIEASAAMTPDVRPVAVAVDSARNLAAVASVASNAVAVVDLATPITRFRISGVQGANGVVYDPVSDRFIVTAALNNQIHVINPLTQQTTSARVGINPTSIAYNGNSSTLVTLNTASDTVSVMDFLDRRIRHLLPAAALSTQGAVAIHPRTNVAIFVDTANNRILLVQLPR